MATKLQLQTSVIRRLRSFVFHLVLVLLVLTSVLSGILSIPAVQTSLANYGTSYLKEAFDVDVQIGRLKIRLPNHFEFNDVFIPDDAGDTVIFAHRMRFDFGGFDSDKLKLTSPYIHMDGVVVKLLQSPGHEFNGFTEFIDKFAGGEPSQDTVGFKLRISRIQIDDARFLKEVAGCDSCFHMNYYNGSVEMNRVALNGAYVTANIQNMAFQDDEHFDVLSLKGDASFLEKSCGIKNLMIKTDHSLFKGDIGLEYASIDVMEDFLNQVGLVGDIEHSTLLAEEFITYIPLFPALGQFEISGKIRGPVNKLVTTNMDLVLAGGDAKLSGDASMDHAAADEELFLDATVRNFESSLEGLQRLASTFSLDSLPNELGVLGRISFSGNYTGTFHAFDAKGALETDLGAADLLAKVQADPTWSTANYNLGLATPGFVVGPLVNNDQLGAVIAELHLEGSGLNLKSVNTILRGRVDAFELYGYTYQNIVMDGKLFDEAFQGLLEVSDPNFSMRFDGVAGLTDTNRFDFKANIAHADLKRLGFMKDSVAVLSALIDLSATGTSFTQWEGSAKLENATFENQNNFFFFENIFVNSFTENNKKRLELRSDLAQADLSGNFDLAGLVQAAKAYGYTHLAKTEQLQVAGTQQGRFSVVINNVDLITQILQPGLHIEPGSEVRGNFLFSPQLNRVHMNLSSPELRYNDTYAQGIRVALQDTGKGGSDLKIQLGRLQLGTYKTDSLLVLANLPAAKDTLAASIRFTLRDSIDTKARFNLAATQLDDERFGILVGRSSFNIGLEQFDIFEPNWLEYSPNRLSIDNLRLQNGSRTLTASGYISPDPHEILRIRLDSMGMDLLEYYMGDPNTRLSGTLVGSLLLSELLAEPKFGAQLDIDSLVLNGEWLGNMDLNSTWTSGSNTALFRLVNNRGTRQTLEAEGTVGLDSAGVLDAKLYLDRFRIKAFDPYLQGILSNLRGAATGELRLTGTRLAPVFKGFLNLPNTGFTVPYVNVDYNLEGAPRVQIEPDRIELTEVAIRDTKTGTTGKVKGVVTHRNFSNWKMDLSVDADRLLSLNTTGKNSDYYYGQANTSGKIRLVGPTDQLVLNIDVRTEKGTEFTVPMGGNLNVSETQFIEFITPRVVALDSVEVPTINPLSGMKLVFNLDVTPDAEIRIILDEQMGDGLTARGSGLMRVTIDPSGELGMYGTYTVSSGNYNFALRNVISKKFVLQEGGTITWNGDPYAGQVDLDAAYTTKTNLVPPLSPESYTGGRTDVNLILKLRGELTNPSISFGVKAPQVSSTVQSELDNYFGDQDRLNRQAFSLLILNSFTQENQILGQGDIAINNTAQLLSNQLSSFISQNVNYFDVSVNYVAQGTNPNGSQEELEVGLQQKLLNDRVTVNGVVGVPVGGNQNALVGDFEVVVNLTEDGRFRAKAFNRNNQDNQLLNRLGDYTQGVGLFYTVDFNNRAELAKRIFGKKEEEVTEPTSTSEEAKDAEKPVVEEENQSSN